MRIYTASRLLSNQLLKRLILGLFSLILSIIFTHSAVAEPAVKFIVPEQLHQEASIVASTPFSERGQLILATVTAYTSRPEETDDTPTIMASGKTVYFGAAACGRKIKFGTRVRINRQIYICEDRLAKKYDNRFDIWMPTISDAKNFGVRKLAVEIL